MKRGLTALLMAGAMAMPMYNAKAADKLSPSEITEIVDNLEKSARKDNPSSIVRRIHFNGVTSLGIDYDRDGRYDALINVAPSGQIVLDYTKELVVAVPSFFNEMYHKKTFDIKLLAQSDETLKFTSNTFDTFYARENPLK